MGWDAIGWNGMEPFHSIPPRPRNEHILRGPPILDLKEKGKTNQTSFQYHVWLASAVCTISGLLDDIDGCATSIILDEKTNSNCKSYIGIGVCYIYVV